MHLKWIHHLVSEWNETSNKQFSFSSFTSILPTIDFSSFHHWQTEKFNKNLENVIKYPEQILLNALFECLRLENTQT